MKHLRKLSMQLASKMRFVTGKVTRQTVHVITDLTAQQASPQKAAHLARSQWTIDNRLHFVRDTTFAEDASKIRTGHGPENMAPLRDLAIDTLRRAGNRSIAAGPREVSYTPHTRPSTYSGCPEQQQPVATTTMNQPWGGTPSSENAPIGILGASGFRGIRGPPSLRENPLAHHGDHCYFFGGRAREPGGGIRERIDMGALLRGHGRAIGRPGALYTSTPERHDRAIRF